MRYSVEKEIVRLFQRDPETGYAALVKAMEGAAEKDMPFLLKLFMEVGGAALPAAKTLPGLGAGTVADF